MQDLPFRLINTSLNDGTLYGHTELTDVFKKSEEYSSLLSRITNAIDADKRGHDVHCTVSSYFRYAMLSHRWGAREPLYHDIQGNVYELKISPGIKKLQGFCQLASKQGFAWAWSDTCCIDKTCSGELQESLNTMFLWYRQSASTIVYLSDVHEASLDLLEKSVWFTRGWTLQELLAPRFLQFYTSDWSLLVDQSHPNSNHKTNLDVLKYVEEITTISKEELQDFVPGVQDARERLRWASSRELTRLEDRAYCLLGIFDVSLSILYGERERSFARLQEEIMKRTDELLLFDWVGASSSMNSLLASQPFCFTEEPCADALKLSSNPLADVVDMPLDITDAVLNKIPPHVQRFAAQMRTRSQSGHFLANGKIILSCFVHSVVHFTLEASNPAETEFTYRVLANDLKPLTITTTMKFLGAMVAEKDFIIANFFNDTVLAKDDHKEKTLTSSSQRGADSLIPDIDADEKAFCSRMLKHHWKPFVGYLLVSQGGGTYRRVPTKGRFIVEPQKGPTMGDNPMLVSTISVQ